MRLLAVSSAVLWVLAPCLLWLSAYRPAATSGGRAERLPRELGGAVTIEQYEITPRQRELLGTGDAVWRAYRDPQQRVSYVVAVFHDENWKSLHPPRICIEGSGMQIVGEETLTIAADTERVPVGRILARAVADGREYLSLYVFAAGEFVTESFGSYFWHHAPRALLRRATSGCLLRVESWVGEAGLAATEQRLATLLTELLAAARAELRRG